MQTALWVLTPQVVALLGIAARLVWRVTRERGRQRSLREFARGVSSGACGEVEIDDMDEDGSLFRVRVVVTRSPRRGAHR